MRCSGHSVILYFDKAETLLHRVAKYDRETERVQSLHFYITHCTALLCYLSVGKLFVHPPAAAAARIFHHLVKN